VFKDCAGCDYGPTAAEKARWEQEDRAFARKTGMIGAGLGSALGAYYGSRHFAPRWTNINLGPRVGVMRAVPTINGIRMEISLFHALGK
jgi:hypothetical protein